MYSVAQQQLGGNLAVGLDQVSVLANTIVHLTLAGGSDGGSHPLTKARRLRRAKAIHPGARDLLPVLKSEPSEKERHFKAPYYRHYRYSHGPDQAGTEDAVMPLVIPRTCEPCATCYRNTLMAELNATSSMTGQLNKVIPLHLQQVRCSRFTKTCCIAQ